MKHTESPHRSTAYNKSFSFGQNRRPRQTIFNIDTSVGKAMSSLNLEQASEKVESTQDVQLRGAQHKTHGSESLSKKSVEFELPNGTRSGTCPTTPTVPAVNGDQHVASPVVSDNNSGALTAANNVPALQHPVSPGVMMPPSFGWTPFYPPFPQGYQYMAGPFTPHQPGNEGIVPSYMASQYTPHPTMFYNNMMMPTPPMMAAPPTPTGQFRGSDQHKGHGRGPNTQKSPQ